MLQTDHFIRFERVDEVTQTSRGLLADLHGEQLRVDVVRPDVVRLKISRGGRFDEEPTFAVCVDPLADDVPFEVERDSDRVRLVTAALTVSVWLDPFRLDVHRADGTTVLETAADDQGRYWAYATLNDGFTVRRVCRGEDGFFGLGEKGGPSNRKGRDYTLWNTDVLNPTASGEFTRGRAPDDPRSDHEDPEFDPFYVSIPFFYHQSFLGGAMAGSFVDNGYRAEYEFSSGSDYRFTFLGGQYTEYVFAGPRMPDILRDYTWLTGRMMPPPIWALGYHQCRWFNYSQEAVEALGRRHREERVPCDALWLDIDYMDGYRVFTWDGEQFPDPKAMLGRLREQGLRVITIVDPGVKHDPGYPVYEDGLERGVFCLTEGGDTYVGQVWPGNTVFPDFATAEARDWWGQLNAAHVRYGLAGIWNDMNEPATGDISPLRMLFDRGRSSHERYHNQYALLMAMGTTAGLLEAMPNLRTFVLSRAGFAGIQRVAANWMGDNLARWDHLRSAITMGSGFGVSGQPFVGADIGGFAGDSNAELFVRWMQLGTLTPFCRNHSMAGNIDQYAWAFGTHVLDLARAAIEQRYRLMPYLYSTFLESGRTGAPVQRPLVFDHQDDPVARDADDQFLLGRDLLVAPVVESGCTARQVYLPEGHWYDLHTEELLAGGAHVIATTPMDRIPLYARAGAVIPMWPEAPQTTDGYQPEVVELHVYVPAQDGEIDSTLAEDDGITFAARDGARYLTTITLSRNGSQLELSTSVEGDGYPEFRRTAFELVFHGTTPAHVEVSGEQVPVEAGRARVANTGAPLRVVADL